MEKKDTTVAPWEDSASEPSPSFSEFSEFADASDTSVLDAGLDDAPIPPEKEPLIDEIASEFVGFWNLLVSKTNWEKGKVIHSWRVKLMDAKLPRRVYSDEALAQRIGNVSPQHVGRLRRVFERFGDKPALDNLYWSHYQAALDWDDAEEWLQKASDEKWSVAQTRVARWEKYGAPLNHKPKDSDVVDSEPDEDVNPRNDSNAEYDPATGASRGGLDDPIEPTRAGISGEDGGEKKSKKKSKSAAGENPLGEFSGELEPWENEGEPDAITFTTPEVLDAISALEELPVDLAEAFETLKVAILTRKLENWTDVTPIAVASYLSEFKRLLVSKEN